MSNPISVLNEYSQTNNVYVDFQNIKSEGPSHDPRFTVRVLLDKRFYDCAVGRSKRDAKEKASLIALRTLTEEGVADFTHFLDSFSEANNNIAVGSDSLDGGNNLNVSNKNPISQLNEYGQLNKTRVVFHTLSQTGPSHNPRFSVVAAMEGYDHLGFQAAEGSSLKETKTLAARYALEALQSQNLYQPRSNEVPSAGLATKEAMNLMNKNPVSALMEYGQKRGVQVEFEDLKSIGPPHAPIFAVRAVVDGNAFEPVKGRNKKDAKREAADLAIRSLMAMPEEQSDDIGSLRFPDRIATISLQKFRELIGNVAESMSGKKVLAAVVMIVEKNDLGTVVSLGSGNKCVDGNNLSQEGKTVNDSHAEVIAKRSFIRFLYKQLKVFQQNPSESIFVVRSKGGLLEVRENISFHMYISTAPCGDARQFALNDISSGQGSQESLEPVDFDSPVEHRPVFHKLDTHGSLSTKTELGQGTNRITKSISLTWDGIVTGDQRLKTMSCSDKVLSWNYLGLQGALLSHFIRPIYLKSLTVGMLYNHGHLSRAVCCRLAISEKNYRGNIKSCNKFHVNHPYLFGTSIKPTRQTDKTTEASFNWCHGDKTPEFTDGTIGKSTNRIGILEDSQVSKSTLYKEFQELCSRIDRKDLLEARSYRQAKLLAVLFQSAKRRLHSSLENAGFGKWITMPPEEKEFS